jgi:hypothetical protein
MKTDDTASAALSEHDLPADGKPAGLNDSPFPGWEHFVPQFVHPVKVAVVEALLHLGEPLSAPQFAKLFIGEGDSFRESNVRYHLSHLVKAGVLTVVPSDPFTDEGRPERRFYFTAGEEGPSW